MKLLVIHRDRGHGSPEWHQVAPFEMYRPSLRRRLGMEVELIQAMTLGHARAAAKRLAADWVMLMVAWSEPTSAVCDLIAEIKALPWRPRVAFLDYYAPTSSPHWGVLPLVDAYIKRQLLRDMSFYQRDYLGGFIFTDFLARELGYDLGGWEFGSRPDPVHMAKVVAGWSLGVTPRYRWLLHLTRMAPTRWRDRPIAVNRRLALGQPNRKREWYERYRESCVTLLNPIARRWPCTQPGRLGPKQYLWEMMRSRVVVSPFGWGEVCFRDYEAVCCGSLLVKPCMDHLQTSPDIYVREQTYVPVRWDLADLTDKIEYYLSRPAEAERIACTARAALSRYYERGQFLQHLRGFAAPGLCAGARQRGGGATAGVEAPR